MTVLIKGMNIPDECDVCRLHTCIEDIGYLYCCVKDEYVMDEDQGRPKWCPLKEEPESIPMQFIDDFIQEHYGKWEATSLGAMLSAWEEKKAEYVKDTKDQEKLSEKLKV